MQFNTVRIEAQKQTSNLQYVGSVCSGQQHQRAPKVLDLPIRCIEIRRLLRRL
jgi:hypothetical protein